MAEFLAFEASGHVLFCFLDVSGRSEKQLMTRRLFASAVSNIVLSCESTLTRVIQAFSGFLMKRLIVTFSMFVWGCYRDLFRQLLFADSCVDSFSE